MTQNTLTIDLTSCLAREDVYAALRAAMPEQEPFGASLDAVWDVLTRFPLGWDSLRLLLPARGEPDERLSAYLDALVSVFRQAAQSAGFALSVEGRSEEAVQ